MRHRFFSVIAVAAILVLVVGSVASAGVVSTVAGPEEVVVTVAPLPLGLAFATPLTGSAYVGDPFAVALQVTKTDTFVAGGYTDASIVAEVKEGGVVVADGTFTFDGSLTWTYVADVGWTAPVDLTALDLEASVDIDFTMAATAAGTFALSFWIETP